MVNFPNSNHICFFVCTSKILFPIDYGNLFICTCVLLSNIVTGTLTKFRMEWNGMEQTGEWNKVAWLMQHFIIWCVPYIANYSRWENFVVAELNCNSLKNIHGWMVVLYGQSLLHGLFHWKSFTVTDRSAKTAKLFHLEQFAIYVQYMFYYCSST